MAKEDTYSAAECRRVAFNLIILMGIISLCGSLVSNGVRSVTGPYLLSLGGTAAIVGLVAGLGEFIGYSLRLLTGFYITRHGQYWALVMAGYGLLLAIPLLAFVGRWEIAAILIIIERIGKAIRAPSRDTILSHATTNIGRGRGFGIHKALDQVGAIIGPLVIMGAFLSGGGYPEGFILFGIPLIFMFLTLSFAQSTVPRPTRLEQEMKPPGDRILSSHLLIPYTSFLFLSMAGFVNFPLISYHLAKQGILTTVEITVIYTLAMVMSASIALFIGREYDLFGTKLMILFPIINLILPFFAFSFSLPGILFGAILWGAALGMQETMLRVVIADFSAKKERGIAYGIMNAIFGTAWFLGSVVMGVLYDVSVIHLVAFILIVEIISIPAFFWMRQSIGTRT